MRSGRKGEAGEKRWGPHLTGEGVERLYKVHSLKYTGHDMAAVSPFLTAFDPAQPKVPSSDSR